MSPVIDILSAIRDPNILGDELSDAQEAALRALYGLPLSREHEKLARQCAGKAWRPGHEYAEAALVCGRRGGKSDKLAANVAIYEAFFRQHNLSAGERGVVLLLAQNMRQAKVVKGYVEGKIQRSPILRRHVVAQRAQELELDNGITIAIYPSSFRAIRGLSVVCCVCDEIAFWFTEDGYANPDTEILRAVRPAMSTFPDAKLLLVSSPYTMSGALWEMWRKRDEEPDVLVWHAPTRLMNPTVSTKFLEREKRRDPENFEREYEAKFTDAVSGFLSAEAIQACVVDGRESIEPDLERYFYIAAIDAAFKGDRFTFCILHGDFERGGKVVVDLLMGWQGSRKEPLKLSDVLPEIDAVCECYNIGGVFGDQFGAAPLSEAFEMWGMEFNEVPFTQASKADIYGQLRSLVVDAEIELLDHQDSLRELRGLEVHLLPGGTFRVGHAGHAGAHDDYADAIALAAYQARQIAPLPEEDYDWPAWDDIDAMEAMWDGWLESAES